MDVKNIFRAISLPLLLALGSGCATQALWTNLNNYNEPTGNTGLRLFEVKQQKDLLVIYDEYSERTDSIHTRAYFLNQSQKRVQHGKRPHFVSTNLACQSPSVPVFEVLPVTNASFFLPLCALCSTNHQSFTTYSNGCKIRAYDLPVYGDRVTQTERIALTPVAVTADLTLVGGILFLWAWSNGAWNDVH